LIAWETNKRTISVKADIRRLVCPTLRTEIKKPRLSEEAAQTLRRLHEQLTDLFSEDDQAGLALDSDPAARQRLLH
jgi:hypothetical protein